MSDDPTVVSTPSSGDAALRMQRASEIFLELRELALPRREVELQRRCGSDVALKELVLLLLEGDQLPLQAESLAEDIRIAHDAAGGEGASESGALAKEQGSRIGPYRLLERIGEGGFGTVFMAEQEGPIRRRVAFKMLKLGMDTRQVVARFEAERQALAMMDHPNIAKVFDAGSTVAGRPYFVMELVKGLPINEYCDQHKMSIAQRLELIALVCDGLAHAHQKGVIHRDIKPSNVLVSTVGTSDKAVPKIIDFGVAKATSARLTEKTIFTEFRQMIGTPEYMSPEQAGESSEDVDTRTDVYSVGVLLYELLVGATPFDSKRMRSAAFGELQRIIREEDPPKPSTRLRTRPETLGTVASQRGTQATKLPGAIRGELDWIVMKSMEKDRSRRYESASAMAADIQRYLAGHAVQAAPPDAWYRASKFVRRNKGSVIAGSLVAFALLAGLVGTSVGLFKAERQRKVAVSERVRADNKAEEAIKERERADANAAEAREAEALANRRAYSAGMLSACDAMRANQLTTARSFLDVAPDSLRGWEWRVLTSRLDTSIRALPCPMEGWAAGESVWANDLIAHPDGKSFFTIRTNEARAAQRWDAATGELLASYNRPAAAAARELSRAHFALSLDGLRLSEVSGYQRNTPMVSVGVWDLRTNQCTLQKDLPRRENVDGILAISPDGRNVVRCNREASVLQLEDIETGAVIASNQTTDFWPDCAWFSRDGALLGCYDAGGVVRILDGGTLGALATLTGHKNILHGMDFSRDGRRVATASIDGTARIWDWNAPKSTPIVLEHPTNVEHVEFSRDASLIATSCHDLAIRVWDARSGAMMGMFTSGKLLYSTVMFMPDGHTVAGRERDGAVRFWDITADSTVNLRGHQGYLNGAYFAERAGLIVSAAWDGWKGFPGCVRFWDEQTGMEVASLGVPGEVAYHIAVSPEGSRAAVSITATDSPWTPRDRVNHNRVLFIDLCSGKVTVIDNGRVDTPGQGEATGIAFDPEGRRLAVGRLGELEIRDGTDGKLERIALKCNDLDPVLLPTWSPDRSTFACFIGTADASSEGKPGRVCILDAQSLKTILELETGMVHSIAFTPNGRNVCIGTPDGLVRTFDVRSGDLLGTLHAHDQLVCGLAFNRDGTRLATVGGDEGDVTVWNTASWDRVARFHEEGFVGGASWDASGERLLGACYKTIRVWDNVPLRDRVALRESRGGALVEVEPMVTKLFEELKDAERVVERIKRDGSLSALQRKTALQVVFRKGLEKFAGG